MQTSKTQSGIAMNRPIAAALLAVLMTSQCWANDLTCISDVTVIDVEAGQHQPGLNVTIRGDRIESVSGMVLDEPGCDAIVDGSGRFAVPGFWDMHVHGTTRAHLWPIYIANGVTGVRDLFGPDDISELRDQLAAASVKPRVVTAGPIVDGPPGIWPGSALVANAEEARQVVRDQAEGGADFIKVYQLLSPEAYFAIIEESAAVGLPVAGHVPSSITAVQASEAGQVTIEHLGDLAVSCSADEDALRAIIPRSLADVREVEVVADRSFDMEKCRKLARHLATHGTWLSPTLAVTHAESREEMGDARDMELLQYFDADTQSWLHPNRSSPPEVRAIFRDALQVHMKLVKFFHEEGVPILAGTDVMNPYTFPGFSFHDELALLVDAGLSPLDALRAATTNAARFLGREDDLGSVAAGKLADIVLLDADPLADIRNSTQIAGVFSNGVYYDSDTLENLIN